ncbi:hypothetical protein V2I01_43060 [Micromonospora sp. BRA006-A]|nr:hypothetical protein [Micromonospora sp. BRA006-A]
MIRPRLPLMRTATRLAAVAAAPPACCSRSPHPPSPPRPPAATSRSATPTPPPRSVPTQIDLNCLRSNRNYRPWSPRPPARRRSPT